MKVLPTNIIKATRFKVTPKTACTKSPSPGAQGARCVVPRSPPDSGAGEDGREKERERSIDPAALSQPGRAETLALIPLGMDTKASLLSRRARVTCGEHSLGNITPQGGERRRPARDARAGPAGTEGTERRAVHRAYPHRPRAGLQPRPPGARAWPRKDRGSREGGSHAVNFFCLFPGTDACSEEAVQGLPPQDSAHPPPNWHVAPSSQAADPSDPAQIPGSSAEARQLPSWAPAPRS